MKKLSLQNKFNDLRKNLIAVLSSNKLKATILAPMVLSLVACPSPTDSNDYYEQDGIQGGIPGQSGGNQGGNQGGIPGQSGGNQGGNQGGNTSEGEGSGTTTSPENPDNPNNPETPDNPDESAIKDALKNIIGEEAYENIISGNISSEKITLTAQTIKVIGDIFPGLADEINATSAKSILNEDLKQSIEDNKEGFVAQAEGYINITKSGDTYSLDNYTKPITFTGDFNLNEISLPANNGKGDFSNATLTNNGEDITIDKLNEIRGSSLPTLSFNKEKNISNGSSTAIYDLYKSYSSNLTKLDISGNLYRVAMDGREISGNKDYTLFTDDGNEAKLSTDTSITSLTADALVQMYKQLTIYQIWNVIISGDATKEDTVNWELRNVVFEGDMSKIKNQFRDPGPDGGNSMYMYGIVYFKNKPYNSVSGQTGEGMIITGQGVKGMIKLDKLEGVSSEYFKVDFASNYYNVVDLRNVDKDVINSYNDNNIFGSGGYTHAIYFPSAFSVYKDNKEEIDKLTYRFSNPAKQGVFNVYLGEDRVEGYSYDSDRYQASSRTPRTLKEFEYFGNTYDNLYGDTMMQFENSARSTYEGIYDENGKELIDTLPEKERNNLNTDATTGLMNGRKNLLAKNDRRIEFIDPETQKIIFSVVNDRQYNA